MEQKHTRALKGSCQYARVAAIRIKDVGEKTKKALQFIAVSNRGVKIVQKPLDLSYPAACVAAPGMINRIKHHTD